MGEIVLSAMVLLLALYGCAQGVVRLSAWLLRGDIRRAAVLLPLSGQCEDAEYQIRSARRCVGNTLPILVVDDGIEQEPAVPIEEVCTRLTGVTYCTRDELDKILF